MKKIAILAMSLLIAGAVFAQTPEKATKKECTKTETCCKKKDGKACDKKDGKACDKKDGKKCCSEKKADKKAPEKK